MKPDQWVHLCSQPQVPRPAVGSADRTAAEGSCLGPASFAEFTLVAFVGRSAVIGRPTSKISLQIDLGRLNWRLLLHYCSLSFQIFESTAE